MVVQTGGLLSVIKGETKSSEELIRVNRVVRNGNMPLFILLLCIFAGPLASLCLADYVPPTGIPAPPFGINEKHTVYTGKTFAYSTGAGPYKDAGNGPYTHYIDNKAGNASDANNLYGTAATPRLTMPTSLAPGAVVEVHGGPYTNITIATNGAQGTIAQPIFIRGANASSKPLWTAVQTSPIKGCTYLVVENIDFVGAHLEIRQTSHHVSVRYCEFRDVLEPGGSVVGSAVIHLWPDSAASPGELVENIVFYQNAIHNNGYPAHYENGIHGVTSNNACEHIWVLENQIYNNGEDNIQLYYQGDRGNGLTRFVYIGGNTLYDESGKMENAVDIKQSNDVIVSSNDIYGYRSTFASDGAAIVLNDDSPSNNLWVVNNRIHDSTIGIRNQCKGEVFVVGNLIENINHEPGQTFTGLVSAGTGFFNNVGVDSLHPEYTRTAHFVNNTIYHTDQGIIVSNGSQYYIENNIISELNYKDGKVWHLGKNNGSWTVKNNLLFETGTSPIIRKSSSVYYSAATFDAAGLGSGDLAADPLFLNAGTDFAFQNDSPAKDAGTVSSVYATFQSLYNLNLAEDRNRILRPVGIWDIGAYEAGDAEAPSAPGNVHVIN